jgi:hypothetical protein
MKSRNRSLYSVVFGLFLCGAISASAEKAVDEVVAEAKATVMAAQQAVDDARLAVEQGKQMVQNLSSDAMMISEVKEMLIASSENWTIAVEALKQAEKSAEKLDMVQDEQILKDYALLARMNANVAKSGAQVVTTGLIFVEAAANNKTETLDVIRLAMQEVQASAAQVRFNSEQVIGLIKEEYSKEKE